MKGSTKLMLGIAGVSLLSAFSTQIFAAGFRLEFQSVSVLADAGEAAVVEDAGTNWYNSAGLVYLPQQFVGGGILVHQAGRFTGTTTAVAPIPFFNFFGSGSANSFVNSFIPIMHYSLPFCCNKFAFGLSIVPAWGLAEDYGEQSLLRYDLTRIYTRTLDIAPSIAMRINDHWSVGAGPDIHYMYASSRSHVRTQPITFLQDSASRFSANSWNLGAHMGVLYRYDDATRVGLNYRTKIIQNLKGYSDFRFTSGPGFESNSFKLPLALPPVTTLSAYRDINPCWAVMGTISYDQWNVLRNFHARNVISPTGLLPDVVSEQHFHNTFDFSLGAHYRFNPQWMFRGSVKYVETPTISVFRDVNFPDAPKLGFNLGARFQCSKQLAFDFIYAHVFTRQVQINGINPLTGATAIGHYKTSIDLAGAQIVWNI